MKACKKNSIILIQPSVGLSGEFSRHPPLSLLYVASGLVKNGYKVSLFDNRIQYKKWKATLKSYLHNDVLFVGLTVMSGVPIADAIRISKFVREYDENIPIIWGGAHPTVMAEQTLEEDFINFTISGSAVSSIVLLAKLIEENKHGIEEKLQEIKGLGFKIKDNIFCNKPFCGFEHVYYKDIPYHLIEDYSVYGQIGSAKGVFPIYSAYGCPYKCAFCVSPYLYKDFRNKWIPLNMEEVVNHIEYLYVKYGASEIYFYDDDSFVDIEHIRAIICEIKNRNLKVKLNFRGARVNEVLKMDQKYLNDLADAGTQILHIGIESGSQRILDIFEKGIKVEDIIKINKNISENKSLIVGYNWIIGTPSETYEDIKKTRELILTLINDNPSCLVFLPNKFRALPGTKLTRLAVKYGYKQPFSLREWINEEIEENKREVWYTKKMLKMIRMLQLTSYFIDNKHNFILKEKTFKNYVIKVSYKLYQPIARFRFKYGITFMFLEYYIYRIVLAAIKRKYVRNLRNI